jgi:hypothetical protein
MPKKGHAMFCNMSPKRENLFSGNKKPRFWDIKSPILGHQCPHFGAIFKHGLILIKTIFYKFTSYMVS